MKLLPHKDEIRKRYDINETDFEVQRVAEFPDPQHLLLENAMVEKKGFWGDFEVWTKKTISGNRLVAVVFISVTGFVRGLETLGRYGYIVYANHSQVVNYVQHFANYASKKAAGFLVHAANPPTEDDRRFHHGAIFPTGSLVYPVTGDWALG